MPRPAMCPGTRRLDQSSQRPALQVERNAHGNERTLRTSVLLLAACVAWPLQASPQPQFTSSEIRDGCIYVIHTVIPTPALVFQMNNLLLAGSDTVVLVDTLSPPPALYLPLSGLIHGLTNGRPVDTLINTSWHFDHVGLNDRFRLLDGTGTILGHWRTAEYSWYSSATSTPECARVRSRRNPIRRSASGVTRSLFCRAKSSTSRPSRMRTAAPTCSSISPERANVMYTGDVYFGGMYPIINRSGGGTVNGMLHALHQVLARIDDETIVVPSHGPIGNRQSVVEFADMLQTVRAEVRALIARGFSEAEVMSDPSFATWMQGGGTASSLGRCSGAWSTGISNPSDPRKSSSEDPVGGVLRLRRGLDDELEDPDAVQRGAARSSPVRRGEDARGRRAHDGLPDDSRGGAAVWPQNSMR